MHLKKYRDREGLFLAEGRKIAREVLQGDLDIELLVATRDFIDTYKPSTNVDCIEAPKDELKKISTLQSPPDALAICRKPLINLPSGGFYNQLVLVLDGIQDPGNIGTLLRTADWFGVQSVLMSPNCADVYNPKSIQASMGAFLRVKTFTVGLPEFFTSNKTMPLYGAFMEGKPVGKYTPGQAFLVLGSEGRGISTALLPFIDRKISIPRFGNSQTESLNVSVAGGILLAAFRNTTH